MNNETETSWLACRVCGSAHPVVPHGRDAAAELVDELTAGIEAFLDQHAGHQITHLRRSLDGQVTASRPVWDPQTTLRLEVTDGRRHYVLIATRGSIEEPRSYRVVEGRLPSYQATVEIDANDVRRSLIAAFYPSALATSQVDQFVRALTELIAVLDPEALPPAFDDANDPDVSIAPLPEQICNELTARCAAIFSPAELPRALEFLRENRSEAGALALRLRRQPAAEPHEPAAPPPRLQ